MTGARLARLWADRVDIGDIRRSWTAVVPAAVVVVRAGITVAVTVAEPFVAAMVADTGRTPAPTARLRPQRFLTDANPQLLAVPAVRALRRISDGASPVDALASGQWIADSMGRGVVVDAGRDAVNAAMAAEPSVRGYLRRPSLPCCGRCAILAGRVYKVDGFARHPGCDCGMEPVIAGQPRPDTIDPDSYFRSLSGPEQNRLFGAGVADRIREGGDIGRAVNADRTMWRRRRRATPTVSELADLANAKHTLLARLAEHGFVAA